MFRHSCCDLRAIRLRYHLRHHRLMIVVRAPRNERCILCAVLHTATNPTHRPSHDAIKNQYCRIVFMRQKCIRIGELVSLHTHTERNTPRIAYTVLNAPREIEKERESEREGSVGNRIFVKESDVVIVACDRK